MSTFSTAAKVYPSHLPQMHLQQQARGLPKKWLTSVAVVGAAGYAANTYVAQARDRRLAEARIAEAAEAERRRALEDLADEYGGRGSIEELERAVAHYGKK